MTIKIQTQDGKTYTGTTYAEAVNEMRIDSWNAPPTEEEYMQAVATRVELEIGKIISGINPKDFLAGLRDYGYLTIDESLCDHEKLIQYITTLNLPEHQRDLVENAFYVSSLYDAVALADSYARVNRIRASRQSVG